jgi:hypothetical protein
MRAGANNSHCAGDCHRADKPARLLRARSRVLEWKIDHRGEDAVAKAFRIFKEQVSFRHDIGSLEPIGRAN